LKLPEPFLIGITRFAVRLLLEQFMLFACELVDMLYNVLVVHVVSPLFMGDGDRNCAI
jgi:hypothetical protein